MPPLPSQIKQWTIHSKPEGPAILDGPAATFKLSTAPIPPLTTGSVLVKPLYLSNDPAQRGWISSSMPEERMYVPLVKLGETMRVANSICEVLDSKDANFKPGDKVLSQTVGWRDAAVVEGKAIRPVPDVQGIGETHFLGVLGGTGLTAYVGLCEVAKARKEDVVVVSGAAGATGSMVVQIAKKLVGCERVVGIAGSDAKCRWVESLGADVCVNYKSKDFQQELEKATEGYADVFFDNVGGWILDLMFARMKKGGRIAACGSISGYNDPNPPAFRNFFQVITQRLEVKGFIILDWLDKAPQIQQTLVKGVSEGKIQVSDDMETVVDTKFEDIPKTWMKLFEGGNQGKLVTKVV